MVVENAKSEKKNEKSSTNRSIYVKNRMCCGIKKNFCLTFKIKYIPKENAKVFRSKSTFLFLLPMLLLLGGFDNNQKTQIAQVCVYARICFIFTIEQIIMNKAVQTTQRPLLLNWAASLDIFTMNYVETVLQSRSSTNTVWWYKAATVKALIHFCPTATWKLIHTKHTHHTRIRIIINNINCDSTIL